MLLHQSAKKTVVFAALIITSFSYVDVNASSTRGGESIEQSGNSNEQSSTSSHARSAISLPRHSDASRSGHRYQRETDSSPNSDDLIHMLLHVPPSVDADIRSNAVDDKPITDTIDEVRPHRNVQSRIVGGHNTDKGAYPFMVSWDEECGGTLIAPNLVLSAAHCKNIRGGVRVGSDWVGSGGVARSVKRQCIHPDYNTANLDNDFIILELDEPVDTNKFTVVKLNNDAAQPQVNEMLTVIGFGTLEFGGDSSDRLQEVQLPMTSFTTCNHQYPFVKEDIHFCAGGDAEGGKDSCQGDSGGPIFAMRNNEPIQVGVVSYGDGCALPGQSGVYARVSGAYDWMQATISNLQAGAGCDSTGDDSDGADENCEDEPRGWWDSRGFGYRCIWYEENDRCNQYGDIYRSFGKTAAEACCVCNGGKTTTVNTPTPSLSPSSYTTTDERAVTTTTVCVDEPPGWYDSDGAHFDCAWYSESENCEAFGDSFENFGGRTANDVCCTCGGGRIITISTSAPISASPDTSTDAPILPPTDAPVVPPTDAPVAPPTYAPVVPPTDAPIVSPTDAPVAPPTYASVVPPTDAPIVSPTDAPVAPPTYAPVVPPTDAPIVSPTDAPVAPPTYAPVVPPTDAPIVSPTDAPVIPPTPGAPTSIPLFPSMLPSILKPTAPLASVPPAPIAVGREGPPSSTNHLSGSFSPSSEPTVSLEPSQVVLRSPRLRSRQPDYSLRSKQQT